MTSNPEYNDNQNKSDGTATSAEVSGNIFRDSALRYMGYANEVGESFRYHFPRMVKPSYVLAFGYCAADALTSGHAKWTEEPSKAIFDTTVQGWMESKHGNTVIATFDTLLWQIFASVLIPGGTINLVVRTAKFATTKAIFHSMPNAVKLWFPTAAGLGSIPWIVHPIDSFVDLAMDHTTRKWISSYKEEKN